MSDPHTVTITLRDVYEDMQAQGKVLAAMDKKLDSITETNRTHSDAIDDHENRIRDLEKMVWKASGLATVFGIVGSTIVQLVIK